jgi:hypothetical protein
MRNFITILAYIFTFTYSAQADEVFHLSVATREGARGGHCLDSRCESTLMTYTDTSIRTRHITIEDYLVEANEILDRAENKGLYVERLRHRMSQFANSRSIKILACSQDTFAGYKKATANPLLLSSEKSFLFLCESINGNVEKGAFGLLWGAWHFIDVSLGECGINQGLVEMYRLLETPLPFSNMKNWQHCGIPAQTSDELL